MVDYRKFKLNVDVTTEEHISRNLIPIITVTVGCVSDNRAIQASSSSRPAPR
jgi:hypothetical protein